MVRAGGGIPDDHFVRRGGIQGRRGLRGFTAAVEKGPGFRVVNEREDVVVSDYPNLSLNVDPETRQTTNRALPVMNDSSISTPVSMNGL